jgi:transposase-like protein
LARRVVVTPVLVVPGVGEDRQKHLVGMRLAVRQSASTWRELVADLGHRGLGEPLLVISDGHPGLAKAIELWPEAKVGRSRCTSSRTSSSTGGLTVRHSCHEPMAKMSVRFSQNFLHLPGRSIPPRRNRMARVMQP